MGVNAVGFEEDFSEEAAKVAVMTKAAVAATMIQMNPIILSMELTFGTIPDNLALGTGTTLAMTEGHTSPELAVDAADKEVLIVATETPETTRGG